MGYAFGAILTRAEHLLISFVHAQDHQDYEETFGEIETLQRKILPAFLNVPLQWKFYVNKVRRACPRSRATAFKENDHLSALFRQRLGNSVVEPQASIVLDIV